MNTNDLITQIQAISTPEDVERIDALIRAEPGKMAPEVQNAYLAKLSELTKITRDHTETVKKVLIDNGVSYPLTDWLSPAQYAKKFNLANTMVVTNWIRRGVIPADCVKEIPELGIKLVKAIEYSPRAYTTKDA